MKILLSGNEEKYYSSVKITERVTRNACHTRWESLREEMAKQWVYPTMAELARCKGLDNGEGWMQEAAVVEA